MTVGGIGQYGGFSSSVREIPKVNVEAIKENSSDVSQSKNDGSVNTKPHSDITDNTRQEVKNKSLKLEDLSLGFQKNDTFDYLGKDSEIANLDMEKAVSDMRKDELLGQYNFFVNSAEMFEPVFASADGMVIPK